MKIKEEKKKRKSVQNSKSEEVEEAPSITEQNKLKQKQKQRPSHSNSDSDLDYGSPYVSDSEEDRNLLDEVIGSLRVPGISKSQEFGTAKKSETTVWPLSKSTGNSPSRELGAIQDFKTDVMDIMDGLEYIYSVRLINRYSL